MVQLSTEERPSLLPLPDLDSLKTPLTKAQTLRASVQRQVEENARQVAELQQEDEDLELVATLIKRLIDAEVTSGIDAVEKLQTEGLQEIFHDQKLSVRAEVGESRGKVTVSLLTARHRDDGTQVEGASGTSFGGSILTMQSILMRVTVLFRRNMRPLLLLDETLAAVANRYVDRAARFLSALSDRLGLDILLITHDEALVGAARQAYQISYRNDAAVFRQINGDKP